jgi:hypothetical protein
VDDPYRIAAAADLILLGDSPEDYDRHFILTADIDLDPNLPGRKVFDKAVIAPDTDQAKEYFQGTPFTGVFDGKGRSVSHLTIVGGSYLGLFGQWGWSDAVGEVRNLGVVDAKITGSGHCVGGLVGDNYWGTVGQCYSSGAVSGGGNNVGGLVGSNWQGAMTDCYSTGVVTGKNDVGGLVGENWGPVTHCYSTGAVKGGSYAGGLVGSNGGRVTRCYSMSLVSGGSSVGGLVGENGVDSGTDGPSGSVVESYSTGAVSGDGDVGGLVGHSTKGYMGGSVTISFWDTQTSGQATSAGGTGKTTAQMQDPNTFMAAGWDFVGQPDGLHDIWAKPEGGGYPVLYWQLPTGFGLAHFSGGGGEPNNPYLISKAEELNGIRDNPRLMKCHFRLVADLDMTGSHFYSIGSRDYPYGGVFDGNGHAISHLTITGWGDLGLFGQLASGDVNIVGSGGYVGGLVGYNEEGNVTQCYSTGTFSGHSYVGGLVGSNAGYSAHVTGCYSTGAVSGTGYGSVGGLVGSNLAVVTRCYSTGAVGGKGYIGGLVGDNRGTVTHCYSTGTVSGTEFVGGLLGGWSVHNVTACFWDIQTSSQTKSAGGTGKTTAEMQTAKTFLDAGWDFVGETKNGTEDLWWILEGKDYPRLWWELFDSR